MNIRQEFVFAHAYELKVLDEIPSSSSEPCFYYPGANREGGKDGLLVRVTPNEGQAWVGIFAFWDRTHEAMHGVFSCPDQNTLCVVSSGMGYVVRADEPQRWLEVPTIPIRQVVQVPEEDLIVLSDFTTACAFGRNGFAWKTGRLAWDRVELKQVDRHRLAGTGWDPTSPVPVEFSIDLATGAHVGGSSPPATDDKSPRL